MWGTLFDKFVNVRVVPAAMVTLRLSVSVGPFMKRMTAEFAGVAPLGETPAAILFEPGAYGMVATASFAAAMSPLIRRYDKMENRKERR